MQKKKILPVCHKPSVITYAHHAYPHCMMECEEYVGEELARIQVKYTNEKEWTSHKSDVVVHWKDTICSITNPEHALNTECMITRECKEQDELIVEVQHLQYSNASSVLNLILTGGDLEECIHQDRGIFRLGLIRKKGLYLKINDRYCRLENVDTKNPRWLKLKRENNHILSYISMDGENFICIKDIEMDDTFNKDQLCLGINTNNGQNQYYDWLYSNYIQLSYNTTDIAVWLDYYNAPRKSYGYHGLHQFIDIMHEPVREIKEKYPTFLEYIKWHIQHEYYMELRMDEYYIPHRQAYQREHYWHNNMIYGFDDEKQVFFIIGYEMKLIFTEVTYDEFEQSVVEIPYDVDVKKERYLPNTVTYKLQKNVVLHSLQEFLYGLNSSEKYGQMMPVSEEVYGIKIFDALLDTKRGNQLLLEDTRITFLLYEHANLMKERIQYLIKIGMLQNDLSSQALLQNASDLVLFTQKLKNTMIINQNKHCFEHELVSMLKELKEKERVVVGDLICLLENN